MEGYCRGIAAGSRKISLSVWTSPYNDMGSYDTDTGWRAYSRLVVEEFREGSNVIAGATGSPWITFYSIRGYYQLVNEFDIL